MTERATKKRASRGYRVFLCGGDETPGERDECPNVLHDFPLPNGYVDASEVAARRLRQHWRNTRCPDCGLYGWMPPPFADVEDQRRLGGSRD